MKAPAALWVTMAVLICASSFPSIADAQFFFGRRGQRTQQKDNQEQDDGPPFGGEPVKLPPANTYGSPDVVPVSNSVKELVDRAIAETSRRKMTAGYHTPWQVAHGILALRWECMLASGRMEVNAIEWMASGQYHDGEPLWKVTPHGAQGHPYTRPYHFEGHPQQFMGYMSMADIPLDYELKADRGIVKIRDIINDAKLQVRVGPEITWTLWAVSHYEDPDSTWKNAQGETWSIERLVQMQTEEAVTAGACGGTHGLFALAYSRNLYLAKGQPLRGAWIAADQKVKRYIEEARSLQNQDGSFSSNHFKGPGWSQDYLKRITTTGHQLEWLMIALPQSRLNEPWVEAAVAHVSRELLYNRNNPSDCGPVFHALHALVLYRQRTNPDYRTVKPTSENQIAERGKPRPVATRPIALTIEPVQTPSVGASSAAINPAVTVEQAPVTKVVPATPVAPIVPIPVPATTDVAITSIPILEVETDHSAAPFQPDEPSLKSGAAPAAPLASKKPASAPAVANELAPIKIDAESGKAGEVAELPYSRLVPPQPR